MFLGIGFGVCYGVTKLEKKLKKEKRIDWIEEEDDQLTNLLTQSMILFKDLTLIPIGHSQIGGRIHRSIGTFERILLFLGFHPKEKRILNFID